MVEYPFAFMHIIIEFIQNQNNIYVARPERCKKL